MIGANIGGLPELVMDGQTGTLVPVDDQAAWTDAMRTFAAAPQRSRETKPRTMAEVASDMVGVYAHVLANPRSRHPVAG